MANIFHRGQRVRWNWGTGIGYGKVLERFDRHVERTIKSAKVSRDGNERDPAYLIDSENGSQVLKLGSELDTA
jgi:hypothetical protein